MPGNPSKKVPFSLGTAAVLDINPVLSYNGSRLYLEMELIHMKKIVKRIFAAVLVLLLIVSAVWYMFVYDRNTVRDALSEIARICAAHDNHDGATWFYGLSYKISDQDQDVAIELAEIYKSVGNYTKAEFTLSNAIADGGNAALYMALCQTYVEQDKLLDAVTMLDNIQDPAIKAELDAMRPAAPTADFLPGFYNQYISLTLTHDGGTLYATTDGEYPTTSRDPIVDPIPLSGGETKVYAITVGDNGLVSPMSILGYTIGGVIEEVSIADPAMEELIRSELMFGSDTVIFSEDLWKIKDFTVPAEAASLEDLAMLTQLRRLTIDGHNISDLSFLTGMTHLEELVLTNCTLGDSLKQIAALPALTKLTISGTTLSTVAELEKATGLTYLDLSRNAIGDLSPLSGMKNLETLLLDHNAVSDISPLSGMSQLTRVSLSHNIITSMAPLASCGRLADLNVSYNKIDAFTAVDELPALERLDASNNLFTDTGKLPECTSLVRLYVGGNQLTDLSPLSTLTNLLELDFSHNQVAWLPAFTDGMPLAVINGSYNALTDISSLSHLHQLNYVTFDYNPSLTDISPLLSCDHLIEVNIYGSQVSESVVGQLVDRSIIVNYNPAA